MAKPKVFVFTTSYHPFIGGAEIAIEEITKRLAHEFDFFIVTSRFRRSLPKRETRPEGTVIRLGLGARFDKWLLPVFSLFYILSMRRDLIGALWGVDIGQGSLAASVLKFFFPQIPFILTVQYGESTERLERGRLGLNRLGFRALLRRADYLTAISKYLLDLSRHNDYYGPAEVIPNGVDLQKFKTENEKVKTTIQNSKCIITVSRLVSKNGIDILIQAIAGVKKVIPGIRCLIIGDGPERENYKLQIANGKLEGNIELFGEIPHEKIPAYLHQADVFVRPSRSEGMGNAFVEALAAGLPIIGTPVGGITDIIEDGKTGLLVRPDDPRDLAEKIIRVLGDPALAERIASNGRQMVHRRFSWDKIASAYVRVFQSVRVGQRLLIATPLFPPEIGGPATYSKLLVDELPQRGIGVRVVPFRLVRHLPKILRHIAYFWRVLTRSRGSDVIFAQDPVSVGLPALAAARVGRKKFILKIVGDYAWEQYQVKNEKRKTKNDSIKLKTIEEFQKEKYDIVTEVRRRVQRFVARRAVRVIVPSEYLRGIVARWEVTPDKIEVVYNAFSPFGGSVSKEEARRRLGIAGDSFVLVSAGRLVPWKGFRQLIEAMPLIRKEIPSARLFIVGSGPEESALRMRIQELELGDSVVLGGGVAHDTLLLYLRAGNVFVLNSSYEGFSHTLLEAMAMEIPIVTARTGGNEGVVEDGVNGLVVEYDNRRRIVAAVERILTDKKLQSDLVAGAKRKLGEFSKEKMVNQTVEILNRI